MKFKDKVKKVVSKLIEFFSDISLPYLGITVLAWVIFFKINDLIGLANNILLAQRVNAEALRVIIERLGIECLTVYIS